MPSKSLHFQPPYNTYIYKFRQRLNIQDNMHSKKIRERKHSKQKINKHTYTKVVKMAKVLSSLAFTIINQSIH